MRAYWLRNLWRTVRSEPVQQFVGFLSIVFTDLPWLHRTLFCSVLLLMRRLHMFVLRMFVTCEDFRLKTAPDVKIKIRLELIDKRVQHIDNMLQHMESALNLKTSAAWVQTPISKL